MMERPTQGLLDNYRTLRKTTNLKRNGNHRWEYF